MALWELSGFIPVCLSMAGFYCWSSLRHHWKGVSPITESLLRSPGESLRLKLEDFNEKLVHRVFGLMITGLLLGFVTAAVIKNPSGDLHSRLIATWSIGVVGIALFSMWFGALWRRRADYDLGFSAERAVGEELNILMLDGYRIFHDFPAGHWNIDHIIVGPSGVYAVETKARRKRKTASGNQACRVVFDGKSLDFGGRKESSALAQAERNARWLSDSLSKALAEPVSVQAILTLPGWFVERRGKGNVTVLNHHEFRKAVVRNGPPVLSGPKFERIVNKLDEKCRDVKF